MQCSSRPATLGERVVGHGSQGRVVAVIARRQRNLERRADRADS
jgi:hypothetical protein